MKKIVIYAVCLLVASGVAAQYHSFGDTIQIKYEQFDFDAWVMNNPLTHGKVADEYPWLPNPRNYNVLLNDDILQYNYTDSPSGVEVVGLSAAVVLRVQYLTPNHPPEYLLLYEATPDSFELKARVEWDEMDTAGRPDVKYLANTLYYCNNTVGPGLDSFYCAGSRRLKLFDIYFDKPITVYDSFYVGGTSRFGMNLFSPEGGGVSESSYLVFKPSWSNYDSTCIFPATWKLYHYDFWMVPQYQWYNIPSNQFLMILPIINVVDTSIANMPACPRVSGMFLRGNYTDTVTVQWTYDTLHNEFEVSYGPVGTAPGDGTVVTVRDNKWQFADSAYNDTPMVVYVRTVCREYDTLRWSEWSSAMHICVHYNDRDTTQHNEGIEVLEEGDDLSRYVQLMPNPANGGVVVMSSYGMEWVEVYDARGGKVYSSPANGTSTGFDVSSWVKGTYVVLVHTPAGTAAKRLVVQ